ncbi:MAG: HEAT repeat domain-containing protein, partial [Fuerstia sp.]|nr:HEAT repeat domain-containing protein [Fuerstiella sp.]
MNTSEVEALFAQTLLGDYEGEDAWTAVSALRRDGSREIFEHAAAWRLAVDPLKRARAAAILCQLRRAQVMNTPGKKPEWEDPEWMFRDESYSLVTKMLENEQNPVVLDSAVSALGHLGDARAVPVILRYQDHPDNSVRFAVCCALGCFPDDSQSVSGLLKLTSDADADVRDWAVFGLGVLGNADSPEIRDALLRCLDDTNEDVREEAAVGLGKRRDQRLIPKLLA